MSDVQTRPTIEVDLDTDAETETGEPTSAHIVKAVQAMEEDYAALEKVVY